MKKKYAMPDMIVVEMDYEEMVATSPGGDSTEPGVLPGDGTIHQGNEYVKESRPGLWDDEW